MHLLDVVVIFGEGGIKLGLHGGRVLPRLHDLILQRISPEHRVAEALQHPRLLAGPLHDVLHRQHMSNEYSTTKD
jgi:hypothetical protein